MAYAVNLSGNQHLTVTNQGKQTLISLVSIALGQQQSQSSSITTGAWTRPPQLYQTASGLVLQINSDQQQHFILIQGNRINPIAAPTWQNAVEIELENIPDSTATPTYLEFEPMQPMQMGNMSMNLDSMSMEMGNMSMSMGKKKKHPSAQRFCTQCGQPAKLGDHFCSNCGHKLDN